jgi:hypothetical protein
MPALFSKWSLRKAVRPVPNFIAWFPFLLVGSMFTLLGSLKLYGALRGVEGGRDKPTLQKLCGT